MRLVIMFLCFILINSSNAYVINFQTNTFADIAIQYKNLKADPKTTLMVFDLDDTLITMSQPLGSVGWWDWQYHLLIKDTNSEKLVAKDYQQLVRIQNILFQLVKMNVTDDYVLPFLKDATQQDAVLMGLTARGKEHLSATLMQLKDNQFKINESFMFGTYGLKLNNQISMAGNFHCPQFSREVIYQEGIMFLDGEDKGEALLCALANTQQDIKTIIFVDDAPRNNASMDKAFAKRTDLLVLNVLYTKENAKELEIQTNLEMQDELFKQWNSIKQSLNKVITFSNF